jgi:plastocyanin
MRLSISALVAVSAAIAAGCSDSTMSTNPMRSAGSSLRADKGGADRTKTVKMMDECEPTSFGAANIACTRNGGVTLERFTDQLTRLHEVPEWKFAPGKVNIRVGDILASLNTGGEVHTFTEVANFGGGIVPQLNAAMGLTSVAPECREAQFIPPGGGTSEVADDAGDEKYQCCIHPWMRAVVHVSEK